MKVGDIVVCKKTNKDNPHLIKGESYVIKEVKDASFPGGFPMLFVTLSNDTMFNSIFSLDDNESEYYFYDYFYTEKELRTEKLKKITQN